MPPEVTLYGGDEAVHVGEDVSLTCRVKGDLPLQIGWTLDGLPVSPEAGLSVLPAGPRTSLLMVLSAASRHGGLYACHAENAAGRSSASGRLEVKGQCWSTLVAEGGRG